jgi:hypothetical protein
MASTAKTIIQAVSTKVSQQTTSATPSPATSPSVVENSTFAFLLAWFLWIIMLTAFSKTRLGYVLLYYSLLLMILYVLVTYAATLGPILTSIVPVGQFNAEQTTTETGASGPVNTGQTTNVASNVNGPIVVSTSLQGF